MVKKTSQTKLKTMRDAEGQLLTDQLKMKQAVVINRNQIAFDVMQQPSQTIAGIQQKQEADAKDDNLV
jgi:hypothetical protein